MKKTIILLRLIISAGILIIFGTAGASDLERIGLSEIFSQLILGGSLIMFGRFGLTIIKAKQTIHRKKIRKGKAVSINRAKVA